MAESARGHGAASVRVIATSAVREAINGLRLVEAVKEATGLTTEVISGKTEADWSHKGVRSNRRFANQRLLVLDVGGGSTEFIVAERDRIHFRESFELGTVRAFEALRPPSDPGPKDLALARRHLGEFLEHEVLPAISGHLESPVDLAVGVGGTTAILALVELGSPAFDRNAVESHVFTPTSLAWLVERLWRLPLSGRRSLPGLPPERADVILTGVAIYEAILLRLRLPTLGISTRGLRFGALLP
jgi:exopolyphosphatase/guanosine-5'-triphosphate,3'-diphosphate pyrophosphatase